MPATEKIKECMNSTELLSWARDGDEGACERLLKENSGLIWSVAKRFFGRGTDAEDLYQLGCIGFLKAVKGFDPDYGTQFSTYAVPKITGEIRRFLRDDGAIKVSRNLKERGQSIQTAKIRLEQKLGRDAFLSEIAEETGLSAEDVAEAETAGMSVFSLQKESGEDGFSLEDMLGSDSEEEIIESIAVREAIDTLPEKERMVILLRYFKNLTQQQTSKIVGVSQVQVSRIERRAVEKLREFML